MVKPQLISDKDNRHYLEKEFLEFAGRSEQFLDFIQNGVLDGIWYWDMENRENEWMDNQLWETLGYDPQDKPHTTQALIEVMHPEDFKTAAASFEAYMKNPDKPYERIVRYIKADGSTCWIRFRGTIIWNADGTPRRMLGVHSDVTTAVKRADTLVSLQKFNTAIVETSEVGIMAFEAVRDSSGQIVDFEWTVANAASKTITGQDAGLLVGKRMLEVFPGNIESGLFESYKTVVETGEPFKTEFYYPFDGLDLWFSLQAFRHAENAFTVTFTDITSIKENAQELEVANKSLEDFASVAAHDLQSPLRHLSMYVDMLTSDIVASGASMSDDMQMCVDGIETTIDKMRHLIRSLHQLSRLKSEEIRFEPLNLTEVVKTSVKHAQSHIEDASAKIEVGNLPTVMGNSELLTSLFSNLISNACKYAGSDNLVIKIHSDGRNASGFVRIAVDDNGKGIDTLIAEKIFEPFQRGYVTKSQAGAGIGLSICRRIATLHKGKISVDSTYDEGARFTVDLPFSSKKV